MRRVRPRPEEPSAIASNAYDKSNSKVGKLMRELQGNITQKGLVLLLVEIAERPEASLDFDIPVASYLNMFLQCQEEVIMSEAGHLILSAARIYSRRVDHIYDAIEQMVVGMDKSMKANEASKKTVTPKPKRAMKRSKIEQDPLYEAEMVPKKLKPVPLAKTTETLSLVKTFEAPKNFFREWEKYKDWRVQHKKKFKCPVPYSVQQDNATLHPSLWKLSSIEDFDYEDDLDTKRNYQVFTNYIEHRHNTLVSDMNFIMHFKVKDFIEAEEDEIEIMSYLGLQPPAKRTWPPLCKRHHVQSNENKDNESISEVSEDYIRNYVELENALLGCDTMPPKYVTPEMIEKYKNSLKGNTEQRDVAKEPENAFENDIQIELNLIIEKPTRAQCTGENQEANTFEDTQPCKVACVEKILSQEDFQSKGSIANTINNNNEENIQKPHDKLKVSDVPLSSTIDSGISEISQTLEQTDKIASNAQITVSDHSLVRGSTTNEISGNTEETSEISVLKEAAPQVENSSTQLPLNEINPQQVENRSNQIPSNKINSTDLPGCAVHWTVDQIRKEKCISDNIIIRLSIDEGVAFSDLDEIDRAMLSPVVELVDILKPVINQITSPTDLVIHEDDPFNNFLDIDPTVLSFKQDFSLPIEVIFQEADITINLFKFPEHRLRRNCFFKLPEEYKIYQKNRMKRKAPIPVTKRCVKLYKLNDGSPMGIFTTPPQSPSREEDFYGFPSSPSVNNDTEVLKSQNEGSPSKNRSISQDSGIEFTENLTDPPTSLNLNQSHGLNNSSIIDISNLGLPLMESTAIQNLSSLDITLNDTLNDSANTTNNNKDKRSKDDCTKRSGSQELPEPVQLNLAENPTEIITKVQNWHRYLKPILHQSKDRHHFDIFAIGSEILDKFPGTTDTPSPALSFDAIMQEKDPSYISRYFLSTLLLANQNNVRLQVFDNSSKQEPTPLNKIQLTLIDRKRHMVSIEDDIGAASKRRPCSSSTNQEQFTSSTAEVSSTSSEQDAEHDIIIRNTDEENLEMLSRHKEVNRDMLIKHVYDHKDDYIRILSKKYKINYELYYTPDEIQRLQLDKDMVLNSESNFEDDCLIYPKKVNIRRTVNKSKNCDDADSGFHSQNTAELESAVVS